MVTLQDQTGTSKKLVVFERETFDSLEKTLTAYMKAKNALSMPVAFASRIEWVNDYNTIAFFYHDTAIVKWTRDAITINLNGFMGGATRDKLNFAIKGHGWVGTDFYGSRRWLVHLVDPTKPLREGKYPQYYENCPVLYDGFTFDSDTGQVLSNAPAIPELDFCELVKSYRGIYNGKAKLPDISNGVTLEQYDNFLDKIVKEYVEQVITAEHIGGSYNHTRAECHVCDEEEEIFERCLDSGDIKPGGWGSIKEQSLALLRNHLLSVHTDDRDHILQHVLNGDYNSTIVWIALKIAQVNPEYWLDRPRESDMKMIRRWVSRYIRRRVHLGIVNVA